MMKHDKPTEAETIRNLRRLGDKLGLTLEDLGARKDRGGKYHLTSATVGILSKAARSLGIA